MTLRQPAMVPAEQGGSAARAVVVTIVMPVFNTGHYLVEAVASVLSQEAPEDFPFELLIVDDASTDPATVAILDHLDGSDPRLRIVANARAKGASGARNTGIAEAVGAWIGFLDSDDYYLQGALASRARLIADRPDAQWVAGLFFLLRDGVVERGPLATRSPNLYSLVGSEYEKRQPALLRRPVEAFALNCLFSPPSILIRRELIVRKGMFDESLRRAEDYHLWYRCALDTDLWVIPEEVYVYRVRPGSLTTGHEPMFFHEHQVTDLLLADRAFDRHRVALLRHFDRVMADYCYFYRRHGDKAAARHWSRVWIRRRPLLRAAWKHWLAAQLGR